MNDQQIDDLKQFIVVTVQQATAGLATRTEMYQRFEQIDQRFELVDQRFDDLQSAIADAISSTNDAAAQQHNNHERRIESLEAKIH